MTVSRSQPIFFALMLGFIATNANADCYSEHSSCTTACAATTLSSAIIGGLGGGYDASAPITCVNACDQARSTCVANEQYQRQLEQQRREAAEQQARAQREQAEMAENDQHIREAQQVASQVAAEVAVQQQTYDLIVKGLEALDKGSFSSAEFQFRQALKIRADDRDARTGYLKALIGQGNTAAAYTYVNEGLFGHVAKPAPANGPSAYRQLIDDAEAAHLGQPGEIQALRLLQPLRDDTPAAIAAFLDTTPKSGFAPFVNQLNGILPAILAAREDEARAKAKAEADERERIARAEAEARAREAEAVRQAEAERQQWEQAKQAYLARFTDAGNGILRDADTGLEWTKNDNGADVNWKQADRYCKRLKLDGKGWRLPAVEELLAIYYAPLTDGWAPCGSYICHVSSAFQLTSGSGWYWTSTMNGSSSAFFVSLGQGDRSSLTMSSSNGHRSLCVRRRS